MEQSPKKEQAKAFSPKSIILLTVILLCTVVFCCLLMKVLSAAQPAADEQAVTGEQNEINAPADGRRVKLTATSSERDMRVVVRDESGLVVTGERFVITLASPGGDTADYMTGTDGSCYIVELSPGEYTVSLGDTAGYVSEPIKCNVKAEAEYTLIQNIDEVIDIADIRELSPNEVKTQPEAEGQALLVPEIIIFSSGNGAETEIPVTDTLGHQVYSYSFALGVNGCLLYRGTDQESDVLPVDEDGDGIPEYGIRRDPSPSPGDEGGEFIRAALYNADNTPVELYAIEAVPLTKKAEPVKSTGGWKRENGHTYYYGPDGQKEVGLKNIDGKLYYFNARGEKAESLGIDVSCFNGHINWNAVKELGIDFAIVRAGGRGWSSGRVYEDTFLQEHLAGARNAGLKTGVYFYSTAVNTVEAVQEASVVIDRLKGVHLDYPVFIDMEYSGSYPRGRADRLGKAARVDIANAFCQTVTGGGYTAGIYASESYMISALDYGSVSRYPYWLANYTENGTMPGFPGRYSIWQFTNSGQMNGITGTVDINAVF